MLKHATETRNLVLLVEDPSKAHDYYTAPVFRGKCSTLFEFSIITKCLGIDG